MQMACQCREWRRVGALRWLQPVYSTMATSPDDAMAMLLASSPPSMEAYRVSRTVNTPRNNREDLLQQVA